MKRYEYKVIDTGRDVEAQLDELGAEGWQVVGVTTKKQLLIAPPQASDPDARSAIDGSGRDGLSCATEPRRSGRSTSPNLVRAIAGEIRQLSDSPSLHPRACPTSIASR